ncbi:MAG: LysR family transcriptional regulator [Steroidobacteraceae bacterium]
MEYKLEDIETLLAAVETGSISAAGLRLNLAKSVVSERIARLERALGATLLRRASRGVTPTEQGHAFYQQARGILQQLDSAAENLTRSDQELSGLLRITAPVYFGTRWLGPALYPFMQDHPRLSLGLELDDRRVDILAGGYDLAIRVGHLQDSSLQARRLATCRFVICCSPDYARRHGEPQKLEDLAQHVAVGYSLSPAGQSWQFEPARRQATAPTVAMRCRLMVNNGEGMRDAAIAGLGLVHLPTFIAADALRDGRLIGVLRNQRLQSSAIWAVYPHARQPVRKLKLLIERLAAAFAAGELWDRGLGINS